ncbi:MAG: catalase [Myxococcales bacterium]|nr:MAG: catalase [Myxococcales bacterium]
MTSKQGDAKQAQLDKSRVSNADQPLTNNEGLRISDDHNSLKAGPRGPTLLEDFMLREKITHFDHERIPERAVHARGTGAFGTFTCTKSLKGFTRANFLTEEGKETPVVVRFSTVAGSKGSTDLARDVRGFAVKFYTDQGNYDLVGNNIPVFFIQDAIKFPDLVHAAKPEPHSDIPQAATAHDTFWDFISRTPEAMHMIMWTMSDRAIPRSLRMMEGFGVNTFRLLNDEGKSFFVKFHFKPVLGIQSVVWDEATVISGKDADFHHRDLWDAIDQGDFPEWDFGVQIVPEENEFDFSFDLLDATKLIPEDLVPVQIVGRLTLNRNPDNHFAEIEQVAFCPSHLVDGIDLSNDPLLQGRLFSYLDTQITRLGGPNFAQIPVNRPIAPVHNNQRDGLHQHAIPTGRVAYDPNTIARGCPMHSPEAMRSFVSRTERVDGHTVRARSASFGDHFSQAQLFYRSQTPVEQKHIAEALRFELSKVEIQAIREDIVSLLVRIDPGLAQQVATDLGLPAPAQKPVPPNPADPKNNIVPPNRATPVAQADDTHLPKGTKPLPATSDALSAVKRNPRSIKTRKVAILVAAGVDGAQVKAIQDALKAEGATGELVAPRVGPVKAADGKALEARKSFENSPSVLYDAVLVPGGKDSVATLAKTGAALHFVAQAFKHCKAIGAIGDGAAVLKAAPLGGFAPPASGSQHGVVTGATPADVLAAFINEAKNHRAWDRPGIDAVPV